MSRLFEYFGPLVERGGYILLRFLFAMEKLLGHGFINYDHLWAFLPRPWATACW